MSCKKGSAALSEALRYVFMPKIMSHLLPRPTVRLFPSIPHRNISNSFAVRRETTPVDPKKFGPAGYVAKPKDEDIPGSTICMRDNQGKLGPPQFKSDVLKSFDRDAFFLVQIGKDDDHDIPVCKVVSRESYYAQQKASNNTRRKAPSEKKEIEIPWKSAEGDIDRKLKVAIDLLEKGKKVDVVIIARRPREIVRESEAAQAIVDCIREKIASFEGIKETIGEGGTMGKSITLHLESTIKQQRSENKNPDRNGKAIEMTWNITDEEIRKKRWRVEQLLTSGVPVDLVLNSKKKAFEIPEEDGDKVLTRVWAELVKIRGIRELESREGTPGKMVTLFLGT